MQRFIDSRFANAKGQERESKLAESLAFITLLQHLSDNVATLNAFPKTVTEAPFQVLITSTRMILAVTLNYPSKTSTLTNVKTVHVIGVETSDQTVIREMIENINARLAAMKSVGDSQTTQL